MLARYLPAFAVLFLATGPQNWRRLFRTNMPGLQIIRGLTPAKPAPAAAPGLAPEADVRAPEPEPEPVARVGLVDEMALASTAAMQAVQPRRLDAPRDGLKDDLKKIKGVGPKLEALLNSHGYWHFDQMANWSPDEVVWIDGALEGFNGRASRDDWVGQAKHLAAGGETEFSKRVDKGEVY